MTDTKRALERNYQVGAGGFTMDLVAARAEAGKGAIYRRWSSKTQLILDAISHMKNETLDRVALPDTGTLRGDLLALFKPQSKTAVRLAKGFEPLSAR